MRFGFGSLWLGRLFRLGGAWIGVEAAWRPQRLRQALGFLLSERPGKTSIKDLVLRGSADIKRLQSGLYLIFLMFVIGAILGWAAVLGCISLRLETIASIRAEQTFYADAPWQQQAFVILPCMVVSLLGILTADVAMHLPGFRSPLAMTLILGLGMAAGLPLLITALSLLSQAQLLESEILFLVFQEAGFGLFAVGMVCLFLRFARVFWLVGRAARLQASLPPAGHIDPADRLDRPVAVHSDVA